MSRNGKDRADDPVVDLWIGARTVNTARAYRLAWRRFVEATGVDRVRKITLDALLRWNRQMEESGLGLATREGRIAALRSLCRWAVVAGVLHRNPAAALVLPRTKATMTTRILSEEEVRRLIEAARRAAPDVPAEGPAWLTIDEAAPCLAMTPFGAYKMARRLGWETRGARPVLYRRLDVERAAVGRPRYVRFALFLFLYATGARVSEAVGLTWGDCQTLADGSGRATLYGKGGRTRAVRVPVAAWAVVDLMRQGRQVGPVFPSRWGRAISRENVDRHLKTLARAAGLERAEAVSAHWLRHSCATHALERGAPIHLVKELLGHASLTSTERYLHTGTGPGAADYLAILGGAKASAPAPAAGLDGATPAELAAALVLIRSLERRAAAGRSMGA